MRIARHAESASATRLNRHAHPCPVHPFATPPRQPSRLRVASLSPATPAPSGLPVAADFPCPPRPSGFRPSPLVIPLAPGQSTCSCAARAGAALDCTPLPADGPWTGGDLLQYINATPMLSDDLARTLFRGLVEGIRFCHVLGIHHRDLKLENLMLTSADPATMCLKIADFGLSDLQTLPSSLSSTFCGSPLYAAPELMTAGAAPDGYDAAKSDVWSCGVVLYALLASALPFDAEDICSLVRLIQRGVPNSPVPEARGTAAAELVAAMLTVDPKGRLTAGEVLSYPWVKEAPKGIKASVTTLSLPQGGQTGSPLAPVPPAGARRRGATATTRFFKEMLLSEAAAAASVDGSPSEAPAAAPPTDPQAELPLRAVSSPPPLPPPKPVTVQPPEAAAAASVAPVPAAPVRCGGGGCRRAYPVSRSPSVRRARS